MCDKRTVAFTICAKNYIGLAQILESSIAKTNPDMDFYIFVADELSNNDLTALPDNVLIAKECLKISPVLWENMSFWYDLTSFCTAIKPLCFRWIMDHTKYEKMIYFDPDIYVFNSLKYVFDKLDSYDIVLTPHILQIEEHFSGDIQEKGILYSGIYNLGFIALRVGEVANKIVSWWGQRLEEYCTANSLDSYFYDQRWIDFLPAFFGNSSVFISRNLGMNVAPWNFYEREIVLKGEKLYAKNRIINDDILDELLFVHYSGYNYSQLRKGEVLQKNIPNISEYFDVEIILNIYAEKLEEMSGVFNKYIDNIYSYNFFDDGKKIDNFHRRLYYSLVARGEVIEHPFSATGIFYKMLKQKKMLSNKYIINVDKVSHNDLAQYSNKLYKFNKITSLLYRIIGYNRYVALLRLLKHYSRFEAQIHLLDKQFMRDNLV